MQPLNHDMEELMRKAAAEYPVIPDGADWDKVAQQLQASGGSMVGGRTNGLLKKLLFLLPLLLAGYMCDRFLVLQHGVSKKFETANTTNREEGLHKPIKEGSKIEIFAANHIINKRPVAKGTKQGVAQGPLRDQIVIVKKNETNFSRNKDSLTTDAIILLSDIEKDYVIAAPYTEAVTKSLHPKEADLLEVVVPLQRIKLSEKEVAVKELKNKKHGDLKKFYVSLLAGADRSRVEEQESRETGYSIGLYARYTIAKRWAAEGGFSWDKKKYYSKGDYFKTDKLYLPQHSTLLDVDGYCTMYNISLNLRYNVVMLEKDLFFASVGTSSYLMQKEDYNYTYKRYNNYYSGNKVYKKASKDWLATGNISVGYERQLNGQTSIRFEPYLKVPLTGIGIGSLPLTSAGVLIGITYAIH